ncbi:HaeII restriction endonuclease [Beggiatoa alba B18LD]|uniref:HaeII restriction endonuclease n=1 Tax=Beggiatoa alba B18LD TaxID=395493 RepID=I3CC74_9GAMM|nr:HaeII family restriction endonuclease [Beggiatoa alba]EIJ41217.1 HaeII restriction endonuclease [Beggiatoa alba B18LD]
MTTIKDAKYALDKIIDKARVHFYKPIQIAEILYRDRVIQDINLIDLATYRISSKKWRDIICLQFLGRTSASSARYQDDLFNDNAIPPPILACLGEENRIHQGIVEAYIYHRFAQRIGQLSTGLDYCQTHDANTFQLREFLALFWHEAGLRRSIDKVYEIIVYALFSTLVEVLEVNIDVSINTEKKTILQDFEDFTEAVIQLNAKKTHYRLKARINRTGVTNAADRGLDMWANFGLAIQVKHLSLTEELAENIVTAISADRIVIVCKDAEKKIIVSLLNQMGWKSKIQSILVESDLIRWYEKALRGEFANTIAHHILNKLSAEIQLEFPSTDKTEFMAFLKTRGYETLTHNFWL